MRRKKVKDALTWLMMNNPLYDNIKYSEENINNLPDDDVPDSLWKKTDSTSNPDASNITPIDYDSVPELKFNFQKIENVLKLKVDSKCG